MAKEEYYVTAQLVKQDVEVLDRFGVDKNGLFEAIGVNLDEVRPDATLPKDVCDRMYTYLAPRLDLDELSFVSMERFSMSSFGVAGYVTVNSPTFLKGFENMVKYMTLSSNCLKLDVKSGDDVRISIEILSEPSANDKYTIARYVIGYAQNVMQLSAKKQLPTAVYLDFPKPENMQYWDALFAKTELYFDAGENIIVYPKELANEKLVGANSALYDLFDKIADETLESISNKQSTSYLVKQQLTKQLKGYLPSVEEIAKTLNMSSRTLQLKLKAENTSYRDITNEVRKELAVAHLEKNILNVSEISYLLGFSEVSSFSLAFKKWTGTAPSAYAA
jgi:AraC-like DNA-binding protein